MKEICKSNNLFFQFLGQQKIVITNYRPMIYTLSYKFNDGFLILHLLTFELIFLSMEEYKYFTNTNDITNPIVKQLIKKWFLVKSEENDAKIFEQIDAMKSSCFSNNRFISDFVIFPTTDCNARCFYCFEHGTKRISMSNDTAIEVANFILKKSGPNPISIKWFGGEPLYNSSAIDIICNTLIENKKSFKSSMISNGYLFDENLIYVAKSTWNLQGVQITLDGTEEIYNKTKAYIYKNNISPYDIVTNNILALLKAGIRVVIRLNMSLKNYVDIDNLVHILVEKYGVYKNCSVQVAILYDEIHSDKTSNEEKKFLYQRKQLLEEYLFLNNLNRLSNNYDFNRKNSICMADNENTIMILPNGNLGKCEHCLDSDFIGNIYEDSYNSSKINDFKQVRIPLKDCPSCKWWPICRKLEKCPYAKSNCNDIYIANKEKEFELLIKKMYFKYRSNDTEC